MSAATGTDPHHASTDAGARPDSETQQVINRGRRVLLPSIHPRHHTLGSGW